MRFALPLLLLVAGVLAACDAGLTNSTTADGDALMTQAKVDFCHYSEEDDQYVLISVAETAVPAHEAHGDASPGDPVPGEEGVFNETCDFEIPEPEPEIVCTDGDGIGQVLDQFCNTFSQGIDIHTYSASCEAACLEQKVCGVGYIYREFTTENGTIVEKRYCVNPDF